MLKCPGYLFWEYPGSYIAQRLPIGTVVSTFVYAISPYAPLLSFLTSAESPGEASL